MFRMMNKLKNRKGFTLIELIVVLAVLAIIMAIAVPRFMGVQEKAKVDADYSTAATIAKAAELYYARTSIKADDAGDLVTADYLDSFEFQSTSYSAVSPSSVGITFTGTGQVTVKASSDTLYPRP